MAGVLFVVCIPTRQHEKSLRKHEHKDKSVMFDFDTTAEDGVEKTKVEEEDSSALLSDSKKDLVFIDVENESQANGKQPMGNGDLNETSVRKEFDKTPTLLDLPKYEDNSMEKNLEELLHKLKVDNAVWCPDKISNYFQVFFSVCSAELCEETLIQLHEYEIGLNLNSTVSVLPCSLYYDGCTEQVTSSGEVQEDRVSKKEAAPSSGWERFVASVGARLTVAQVVEKIKTDACLTFDFLMLLLIAAVVATLGLIENSTVMLVASMLISPLMGPIMAGTFGNVIEDRRLRKMGVLNELVGLFICLLVGFVIGLACGAIDMGTGNLPTEEMLSRGRVRSLWVGALIALPSGAAVAIALLGDKTGSLVGVAISASILPPAVNAGLLWALSFVALVSGEGQMAAKKVDEIVYSNNVPIEMAILGAVSLCLTLVNILCIFLMGILVLKIKEVAPRTSGKQSQFWKHDIKIARDYNKTVYKEDGKLLQQQLAEELAGLTDADLSSHHISPEHYRTISNRLLPRSMSNQHTWSPSQHNDAPRLSVRDLEELYSNLTGNKRSPVRRQSSWMPTPDPATPAWYRNHHFSPPAALSMIRESSGLRESLDGGAPQQRRMTYAHETASRQPKPNPERFFVSPVEEND